MNACRLGYLQSRDYGECPVLTHRGIHLLVFLGFVQILYIIPLPISSFRSSHTVLPEHEQTVLSFSHTPALLAMTPTKTFVSSRPKGPSLLLEMTILRPMISHIATALSRKVLPLPSCPTFTDP